MAQEFQPTLTPEQVRAYTKVYDGKAHLIPENTLNELKANAEYHQIPFYTGDFDLLRAVGQFGAGLVEGFTTVSSADHPENEYEAIFRNIGHLAGFAPGIARAPLKFLGGKLMTRNLANSLAQRAGAAKSVPLYIADQAERLGKSFYDKALKSAIEGRGDAVGTVSRFLNHGRTKNIIQQSFHLGTASAVSSWQGGVDQMMDAFIHGGIAGGAFAGIGELGGAFKGNTKVGQAIAGSLFQGLPSTVRGATTPQQIYDYLLGAYFGGGAKPWTHMQAGKFIKKMDELRTKDFEWATESGMEPTKHPDWNKLPEEVKPIAKKMALSAFGTIEENLARGFLLLEKTGNLNKMSRKELEIAGFKATEEFVDGERVYRPDPKSVDKYKIVMLSGGSEGAQQTWALQAQKKGIPTIHYTFSKHEKTIKSSTPGFRRTLSKSELQNADSSIRTANLTLKRPIEDMTEYVLNLQRRNAYQINNSEAVYAIGEFAPPSANHPPSTRVKGGTGWGVQMGIDKGKSVYLYEQSQGKWFKWNKAADRFTTIKEPPKPPSRWTGLGVRKINQRGSEAISSFLNKHFKDDPVQLEKISKKPELEPMPKDDERRVEEIRTEIDRLETEHDAIEAESGSALEKSIKIKALETKYEALHEELSDIVNRGVDLTSSPIERVKEEAIEVKQEESAREDNDFERPTEPGIGINTLQLANNYFKKVWGTTPIFADQTRLKGQLGAEIASILKKFLRPNTTENLSEQWANEVESFVSEKYFEGQGFTLGAEARGKMRQMVTKKNLGGVVTHLRSDGSTVMSMSTKENQVSLAGARKDQIEPQKRIDFVFKEAIDKATDAEVGGKKGEPTYMVLDHVTVTENGKKRDISLGRWRTNKLLIDNRWNPKKAEASYNLFIEKSIVKLGKQGYYPFSGKGDAERVYYVKFHPQTPKSNATITKLINEVVRKGLKHNNKFKGHYEDAKKDYLKKYNRLKRKDASREFDKMWISNILYDMGMNGLDINPKSLDIFLNPKNDFISSSKAFNKRSQVWFNNYFPGDTAFIKSRLEKTNNPLNTEDKYNYFLTHDLSESVRNLSKKEFSRLQKLVSTKNVDTSENVDGAIIVHDSVVDVINKDFGNPVSGQNKSFIVSPNAEKGALLGKYMIHKAGPELSKLMEGKDLHMIIHDSAAKQKGTRKLGDYRIENGELILDGEVYHDLSPEHIKGSYGVYGNPHFLDPQRVPKQLLGALLHYSGKNMPQETINEMFNEIVGKRWEGDKVYNDKLTEYMDKTSEGVSHTQLKKLENEIINNIEKIGVKELVDAMKMEYSDNLVDAVYKKILRLDKEMVTDELYDGESNIEQVREYVGEVREFDSIMTRAINSANRAVRELRGEGQDITKTSIYMHKFIRDYRMKAVQNFLVNTATKPKMDNSGVGYMRPYDKGLRNDLDGVNKLLKENNVEGVNYKDNLFFLDNAFKDMIIKTDLVGKERIKLGELWDYFKSEESIPHRDYLKELFRAVSMRVPMDSISGAQIANFSGFTGRDGHGILLHGRSMKAQGGADLDGDKSFFFFGGRNGFKKSWKDLYKANKEEFFKSEKGELIFSDSKDDYRSELAFSPGKSLKEKLDSRPFQWAPNERLRISEAASDGRAALAPAVSNKQIMSAAYNSIIAGGGKDEFITKAKVKGNWKELKLFISAKQTEADKQKQRELGRAMINFAADPMDELGLKSGQWNKKLWNSYFKIDDIKVKSGNKWVNISDKAAVIKSFKDFNLAGGIFKDFKNVNSAYWGRNWSADRKYNMHEIRELGNSIYNINDKPEMANSVLSKTGELLAGLDWSDSILGRVSRSKVEALYSNYNENLQQFDWLKKMLGRTSFRNKFSPYINNALKFKLYTQEGVKEVANEWSLFKKAIKGTLYDKDISRLEKANKSVPERVKILRELNILAEDFIINNVTDLVSVYNISSIVEKMIKEGDTGSNILKGNIQDVVGQIHKETERIKKLSYLQREERRNFLKETSRDKFETSESDAALEALTKAIEKATGKKFTLEKLLDEAPSATLDRAKVDLEINNAKKQLSDNGKRLFDEMILGSLNRTNLNKIESFTGSVTKWTPDLIDLAHNMYSKGAKTSMSKLGWLSNAVSDQALDSHVSTYLRLFNDVWRKPSNELIKETVVEADKITDKLEVGMPEVNFDFDPMVERHLIPSGWEGVKKGKLTPESTAIVTEIANTLKTMPNHVSRNLGDLVRGLFNKNVDAMNKLDYIALRNYLNDIKSGSIWQRMFNVKDKTPLGRRHYWLFPQSINRELMRDDMILMKERGLFFDKFGKRHFGTVRRPTQYIDIIQSAIAKFNDRAVQDSDKRINKLNTEMSFYVGLKESLALWEVAIRKRELGEISRISANTEMTDAQKEAAIKGLNINHTETLRTHKWDSIKDKENWVTLEGKRVKLTNEQIVGEINKKLTNTFKDLHKFIRGEEGALEDYVLGYYDKTTQLSPIINYKKFIDHLDLHLTGQKSPWGKGTDVPSYFGIDGLRAVSRSMMLDMIPNTPEGKKMREKIQREPILRTGKINFENYFPHMFFDRAEATKALSKAVRKILETPNSEMTEAQKKEALKKAAYRHKSLDGDWVFEDLEEWRLFDEVLEDISKKRVSGEEKIKFFNANVKAGSMHSRTSYLGGWSIGPQVVEAYTRSLSNTYHRQLSQMYSRQKIHDMYGRFKKIGGEQFARSWQQFLELYVSDSVGNPSVIPERMYKDKNMKLSWNPYAWGADNRVRDRLNKILEKLGIGDKRLPKDMRGLDLQTLRHWSNLEAQYQMASLLAHPKSMVANIFGGTMHTIQSTGWKHWKNARDIKHLNQINPKWKSRQDINDFVTSLGVLPEYLVYEMGLEKRLQNPQGKSFLAELSKKLTRHPDMSDKSVRELARSHGLRESVANFAASFMTVPERALRRDSFMAHYLQAWEKFGGAVSRFDDPYIVEMAKKGVKATQFLYSAPFRPAFARTSLGKVLTRFQLWSWNSVRFRNDVMREARIYGLRPGSETYEKFQRLAQIDLFVFALANTFAYSLFESNLPQPWGWFQDTADWIFGDEGERDRAFYGAWPKGLAPLQAVTPPILRLGPPAFKALLEDDWSRVSQYYIWTMFPFGRMARDLFGQGNIIENPIRVMEKTTGFPLGQLQRKAVAFKKDEPNAKGQRAGVGGIVY